MNNQMEEAREESRYRLSETTKLAERLEEELNKLRKRVETLEKESGEANG